MCGFAGVINSEGGISGDYLRQVAGRVSFRGPDSTNVCTVPLDPVNKNGSAFFFNRLAILDLNPRSDQPFTRNNCHLVFNGEIYNYKEIRKELESSGFKPETTSDTEILFYAIKHWGKSAINRLNGMFSFCWLDNNTGTFLLCRDRVGIKPLYYCQSGSSLIFGSELHSILRLLPHKHRLSEEVVKMYLWLQYVPTPFTIMEGIFKLPPGHYIDGSIKDLRNGNVLAPVCYWDAYATVQAAGTSSPDSLESVLKDALGRQLEADVPLGLFLSSGVDSSLLAALVNKYFAGKKSFSFFTVAFEEQTSFDESSEAELFIRGFNNKNLHCHTLRLDPSHVDRRLDKLYDYFDEPFADSASVLNWAISEKAREHVTVAISGDGADELFWGYPRYEKWKKLGSLQLKGISPALRSMVNLLPSGQLKYNALYALEQDPVARHFETFLSSGLRFLIRENIVSKPLWALHGVDRVKGRNDLPAILDIKTYLADAMLYKVDRASMAASLEVRVPYLDNEVIDLALHLPFEYKSNMDFRHKAILKKLLTNLAPHYDVNKPKRGFNFPVEKWLRGSWKERVCDSISKNTLQRLGLDPGPYLKIVDNFYRKGSSQYTDVWALYNLALWSKNFEENHSSVHNEKIYYPHH